MNESVKQKIVTISNSASCLSPKDRAYIARMAAKRDPKADESYSEEETARRRDATVKAMIGMRPKPHQPLTPKRKERPASKGRVHKGKPGR